jgi:hypothetical protein
MLPSLPRVASRHRRPCLLLSLCLLPLPDTFDFFSLFVFLPVFNFDSWAPPQTGLPRSSFFVLAGNLLLFIIYYFNI